MLSRVLRGGMGPHTVFVKIAGISEPLAAQVMITPSRVGTARLWLQCPRCAGLRVALYLRHRELGCRACWRLEYCSKALKSPTALMQYCAERRSS